MAADDEFTVVSTGSVDEDTPIKAATGLAFKTNDDYLERHRAILLARRWDEI